MRAKVKIGNLLRVISESGVLYINCPDIEALKIPTYSGKRYQSKEVIYTSGLA